MPGKKAASKRREGSFREMRRKPEKDIFRTRRNERLVHDRRQSTRKRDSSR
jgi:hypothetical protein